VPATDLYDRALRTTNPTTRGHLLEDVVVRLFEEAHFAVKKNAGAAAPRQTDLVAQYGPLIFLVEVKWTKRPVGTPALDEVRARLSRATRGSMGLLVSIAGFAQGVISDIEHHRHEPILLVSRVELERVIDGTEHLRELLRSKEEALELGGAVLLDTSDAPPRHAARGRSWRRGPLTVIDEDGRELPWIQATGSYDVWLPTLQLADPDWAWTDHTSSVYTRARLEERDTSTVHDVLDELRRIGWLASGCSWVIRQADTNWFGFDEGSLLVALEQWRERYASSAVLHHTEEIAVTGQTEGVGLWLIEADIATERRWTTRCELSLVLEGWPLDPEPLRRLFRAVGAEGSHVLRPITGKVVTKQWEQRDSTGELEVVARIVSRAPDAPDGVEEWVVGVVAKHPGRPPTADDIDQSPWRAWTADNDVLPMSLRSWHPHDDVQRHYRLLWADWSELPHAVPGVLMADWVDGPTSHAEDASSGPLDQDRRQLRIRRSQLRP
jgi:hypothetical protein